MKHFKSDRAATIETTVELVNQATHGQVDDLLQRIHARNKAHSMRNWSQVEQFLTQVEKAHGLAKAWRFRVRLERGHVTLDELKWR